MLRLTFASSPRIGVAALLLARLLLTPACAADPPTVVLSSDFETPAAAARVGDGLKLTTKPDEVLAGKASLLGDSRASTEVWNEYLHTRPGLLKAHEAYTVTLEYRILTAGAHAYALFRRKAGGNQGWWDFTAPAGAMGRLNIDLWTGANDDWCLLLGIENKGAVVVDTLTITTNPRERVVDVTFPTLKRTWTSPGHATFYVDSEHGNDAFDGKSEARPWKTLTKVNAGTFGPGDQIRLKAGSRFDGCLAPGGKGSQEAPILVSGYGAGALPAVDAEGKWQASLYLHNVEYIEVSGLDLANKGPRPYPGRTAVTVNLRDYGEAHGIALRQLEIHDVNGSNVKDEGGGQGIACGASSSEAGPKSRFVGLQIEACHLVRCDRNGIGLSGAWSRQNWYPHLGVVIRHNLLEDIGGDGIVPIACDGALVEHNTLRGGRQRAQDYAAGIWPWSCDNTVVQFNEVSRMKGTRDGQGFDSDWNCRNTVFQYNYSHDNDGGFMLICNNGDSKMPSNIGNVGTIIRYNISQNDGERIFHFSGPVRHTLVHNNVIYLAKGRKVPLVAPGNWGGDWPEDTRFANNLFQVDGETSFDFGGMRQTVFDHNVFFGTFATVPEGTANLRVDPQLLAPGRGGDGFESLDGYRLRPGSPCLAAGAVIPDNGGHDFWDNPVPKDAPPAIGVQQP